MSLQGEIKREYCSRSSFSGKAVSNPVDGISRSSLDYINRSGFKPRGRFPPRVSVETREKCSQFTYRIACAGDRAVGNALPRRHVQKLCLGRTCGKRVRCPQNQLEKGQGRSEERSVGKECVSTCKSWWSALH